MADLILTIPSKIVVPGELISTLWIILIGGYFVFGGIVASILYFYSEDSGVVTLLVGTILWLPLVTEAYLFLFGKIDYMSFLREEATIVGDEE